MDLRSHYPFWLMKNGILANYPSLQKNIKVDVAIMGAGISGALAAYYLSDTGLSVAVVDRRHVGMGSTAASTALLQYEIDTPLRELYNKVGEQHAVTSYKLCLDAIYKLKTICGNLHPKIAFNIKPSLQYASFKKHKEDLYKEYLLRHQHDINVQWLEPADIKDKFGFTAPGAILSAEAGEIDAYLTTHRLLQFCEAKGHQVYDTTDITDIIHHKNNVQLHTDTGHTITARHLIIAAGYESLKYIPRKVATLQSTYALVTEPVDEQYLWYERSLVWETQTPYLYFRATDDNRILIGGKDDDFYNPDERDARVRMKAKQLINTFRKKLQHLDVRTDFSWAGTFAGTRDGLPYIGSIPQRPHTYFALGFGGNGITFSVIAAEIIRNAILGKKDKHADIFSFDR